MSQPQPFHFDLFGSTPVQTLNQKAVDPRDYMVLQRIPLCSKERLEADRIVEGLPFQTPLQLNVPQEDEEIGTLTVLDTETTGLSLQDDEVIELGMVKATYAKKRQLILRNCRKITFTASSFYLAA